MIGRGGGAPYLFKPYQIIVQDLSQRNGKESQIRALKL